MFKFTSSSVLLLAGLVSAQNVIDVQVGSTSNAQGGIFQFIPNNIQASKDDVVRFTFSGAPGNHSVTQSSLAKPCDNLANGFDSGWVLIPNADAINPAPEWNLTITDDTKPLWFYCKQAQPAPHCGAGMVGAINANATAMTTFQNNAKGNTNPGEAVGALVGQGAFASALPGPFNNGATIFGAPDPSVGIPETTPSSASSLSHSQSSHDAGGTVFPSGPSSGSDSGSAPGPTESSSSNGGLPPNNSPNVGAIAGGVVGGVIFCAMLVLIWWMRRRYRRKNGEMREYQRPNSRAPEPFTLSGPVEGRLTEKGNYQRSGAREFQNEQSSASSSPRSSSTEGQPRPPNVPSNQKLSELQAEMREMQAKIERMNREMSRYLIPPAYASQRPLAKTSFFVQSSLTTLRNEKEKTRQVTGGCAATVAVTLMSVSSYRRKLRGWLSYAFASEVFVIVSLTLFLPICLEQFARDNGYLLPDKTTSCIDPSIATNQDDVRCVVKIGWVWIDTASFSLYVYSFSVFLQALTVISVGGIADHPSRRKRLLLSFAFSGALSATLFLLLPSDSVIWWISAFLAAIANVGFGTSVVAMNSYLPGLAREAPEVTDAREELERAVREETEAEVEAGDDETICAPEEGQDQDQQPLLSTSHPHPHSQDIPRSQKVQTLRTAYTTLLSQTTSRISSQGIALGYGSGILLLALALVPVTLMGGSTTSLRLAIGLSGIWWALFTIPAGWWLPGGEDSPKSAVTGTLEADEGGWTVPDVHERSVARSNVQEIAAAWKRLGGMLKWSEIKKLRNTFKYLGAWFLLSDGFSSITSTAMLFGKTSLHMSPSGLILIGILVPLSAIGGSLVWPKVQKRWKMTNQYVLLTLLVLASLVPLYGCLGFLFEGSGVKFGGLTTQGEMYVLGVYFGFVYGAFQGYARAFYAELLPPGEEARWMQTARRARGSPRPLRYPASVPASFQFRVFTFSPLHKHDVMEMSIFIPYFSETPSPDRFADQLFSTVLILHRPTLRRPHIGPYREHPLLVFLPRWDANAQGHGHGLPLPPGPKKLPLIGNLLDMPRTFEWERYDEMCRVLGTDILHLNVAGTSIVVMNSAEAVEDLLDKHSVIHSNRPRLVMVNELMGWNYSFALIDYGDEWRAQRKLFQQEFTPVASERYQPVQTQVSHQFLKKLLDDPENFVLHIRHLAASTILGIAYGLDVQPVNDPYVEAAENALESLGLGIAPGAFLVETIPALKYVPEWVPGAGFKRKAREWAKYSKIMREMPFNAAKEKIENGTAKPSFTSYSLESLESMKDGLGKKEKERLVQSTAATMYTGATDSTVSVISTFFLAMLANPEAQRIAQEQIDSVIPAGELPKFSDMDRLPYVSAIVKECLRWKNVTPLGIPHASVAEDVYRGYRIPKGSIMIPNIWGILHDEKTYPEPHSFKPERFIGKDGKINPTVKDPDSALFGFGRRICPGRHMGYSSIWIAVASLLATFRFEKPLDANGNVIEPTYEYISSLACVPAPFKVAIRPRNKQAEETIRAH
ncbi:hypothetical protein D9758_015574 [Tetrapyrgos nigripes]|uniref:Cytochrome P450 n=1 Tax=Tetrapyrgos nigripes TaxID=182062 RepID=A0A8H5CBN5_9AGAR|nr:hypothetical protein D9758_015574 [Tetrapyrgos nigripes]